MRRWYGGRTEEQSLRVAGFVLIVLLGACLLLWCAALNGYPLVFDDVGTYILSSVNLKVPLDRPIGYSLFIRFTRIYSSLWLVVIAQAGITSLLMLRTVASVLPAGPHSTRYALAFGVLVATAAGTSVARFVGYAMPDIFAAWLFLGAALFLLSRHLLDRLVGGSAIVAATLVHNGNILLAVVALVLLIAAAWLFRAKVPCCYRSRARDLGILVLATIPLTGVLNLSLNAGFTLSRGTPTFLLNRFIESGVLSETLATYCPNVPWTLCNHQELIRAKRGATAWFLWSPDSPIREMGWEQGGGEQTDMVVHAFRCCLTSIVKTSVYEGWRQFWQSSSAADLPRLPDDAPAARLIAATYPGDLSAFRASVQESGGKVQTLLIPADESRLQAGLLLGAFIGTLVCLVCGHPRSSVLIGAALLYVVVNALLVGSTNGAYDRLQARVTWLVPFTLAAGVAATSMSWSKPRVAAGRDPRGLGPYFSGK